MDPAAYLTKHGWLGTGHSLHPRGHGIKKPLLGAAKLNLLGVGKKKNDIHADQWWARMFDSTLKDLDIGSKAKPVKPKALPAASSRENLDGIPHRQPNNLGISSLYANFVKGEGLAGTMEAHIAKTPQTNQNMEISRKRDKKRKVKSRRKHDIRHRKP